MITPRRLSEPPGGPRRPPARLWPLLLLPIAGLLAGTVGAQLAPATSPAQTGILTAVWALYGLLAGAVLMGVIAFGFLTARVATRRFTIRSMLIGVGFVALALGLVRACLP